MPLPDLYSTRQEIRSGARSAVDCLSQCMAIAQSPSNAQVFLDADLDLVHKQALQQAQQANRQSPLAGLAVSVKDLFDITGQTTAAGSVVLAKAAPAQRHASAVARLLSAGASIVGRTNMSEFAFSGVGWNPHYGTPINLCDPAVARIPGGSSSGAAVSVATGAAFIGLGSDTGGSIRIPAALCGIVGFKSTAHLVPTDGALPLSTTLDTVAALTRSVRDAVIAHEVLAARTVPTSSKPLSAYRVALVGNVFLDNMDSTVAKAFERSARQLQAAGAQIDRIDLPALNDLPTLQAGGGFSAPESYAWHRHLLATQRASYDPRVAVRIERGAAMLAYEYVDLHSFRKEWIARMRQQLSGYDAVLSPTVPIVAPPIAAIATDDAEFFRTNALLLRNTSVINLFDGCALSLPCHQTGELPVGLMLWSGALQDDTVLQLGLLCETALRTS